MGVRGSVHDGVRSSASVCSLRRHRRLDVRPATATSLSRSILTSLNKPCYENIYTGPQCDNHNRYLSKFTTLVSVPASSPNFMKIQP